MEQISCGNESSPALSTFKIVFCSQLPAFPRENSHECSSSSSSTIPSLYRPVGKSFLAEEEKKYIKRPTLTPVVLAQGALNLQHTAGG